jgi:hypothetical protein
MTEADRAMVYETLRQYALGREFTFRQTKAGIVSPVDGMMYNKSGIAVELVRVKLRPSPMDKYPTLKIDKSRIDQLLRFAKQKDIRAVLVVNWAGDIRWLNLTEIAADDPDPLFPEATIKGRRVGEEDRAVYQIDTVLFRPIAIQPYQVTT